MVQLRKCASVGETAHRVDPASTKPLVQEEDSHQMTPLQPQHSKAVQDVLWAPSWWARYRLWRDLPKGEIVFELHQLFCLRIRQVTIVFKTCLRWPIRVLIIINKLSCWFQVFCEKYNLSFHQPLKDACSKCTAYDLLPVDERTPELTDFIEDQHR